MPDCRIRVMRGVPFAIVIVSILAWGCAPDEPLHATTAASASHKRTGSLDELLAISAQVFERTDWNTIHLLDHLALIGDDKDAAFAQQTRELAEHTGGYLCAGMATYLSYVLSQRGYENVVYNSGTSSSSHAVALVDLDGGLYMVDVLTGLVAPRFDAVLKALLENEHDFKRIFAPLKPGITKRYFSQQAALPSAPGERRLAARFDIPGTIVGTREDGSLAVDVHEERRGLSDCQVSTSGVLSCRKTAPEFGTYAMLEEGIEARTGVPHGLFMIPLNLEAGRESELFTRYPYLRVLDDYAPRFRAMEMVPEPDRAEYARLVAGLRRELLAAIQQPPSRTH